MLKSMLGFLSEEMSKIVLYKSKTQIFNTFFFE